MKITVTALVISLLMFSCNNESNNGKFTVSGNIKNVPDQQIFLDQLFFSQKNPEILDTAQIKNGKFELSGIATEEGLYRIRFEKLESGFIFINDKPSISFTADINDVSLEGPVFNSPANTKLKNLLIGISTKSEQIKTVSASIDSLSKLTGNDSLVSVKKQHMNTLGESFVSYITRFIDTTSDPVVAMFALGYTRNVDPNRLKNIVPGLQNRFPKHQGVASIVIQFNQMMAQQAQQQAIREKTPQVGSMAPDFTINDADGKPVSLSQFRGKYVLVDFWASWCGPCRQENPNVVAAYNQFHSKGFEILGVSLDDNKSNWQQAIKKDNLTWTHVSDLEGWDSKAAKLYGVQSIPTNFLLDKEGKIIARDLRGADLANKLQELFQ